MDQINININTEKYYYCVVSQYIIQYNIYITIGIITDAVEIVSLVQRRRFENFELHT